MFLIAQFDNFNQKKLFDKLSEDAKEAIINRIEDGGENIDYLL